VYPISTDHPGNRGILNKMEHQWAAFSELTGTVDLICSSIRGPILNGKPAGRYPIAGRAFNPLNHYGLFYFYVTKYVKPGDYDFLYIRYPFALPSFLGFLRQAKRANPRIRIFVEIATFPYRLELQTPKQRVLRLLDDLGHRHLKSYVDAIITFYGQSEIFEIPCIQLRNGIDVRRIPVRGSSRSGDGLAMIAVGNLADRHGIDRALHGMAQYVNQPASTRTSLHVVGDGPARAGLMALTKQLGIDEHVRFHGLKTGPELDDVFDRADVALDSLATHRLNLPRSSSLKAREYCARGIPFALAGDDPDFPAELPFVHHVPSNDEPLDIPALVQFHTQLRRTSPAVHRELRSYAEKHLTWKAKLGPVVERLGTNPNGEALVQHLR